MKSADFAKIIKDAREAKDLTQQEVADFLGVGLRNYQHLEAGRFPKFKSSPIRRLESILNIKIYDKLYGNATNVSHEKSQDDKLSIVEESEPQDFIKRRREQKNSGHTTMVPLVPVKAQAGYAHSYSNTDFLNKLELYPILPGIDPRGAVWRYFEVQGDSMEPGLYERDLVLVSMVPPEDWKDVKKEQVYVIVTGEEVLIKLIFPIDRENWLLRSTNKRHKDRKLEISNIKELWYFRRLVSNKLQWQKK